MMKKTVVIIALLLLAFSLTACSKAESRLSAAGNQVNTVPSGEAGNGNDDPDIKDNPGYEIIEVVYSKHDDHIKCDIKYPQISGLSDSVRQKQINDAIKAEALKALKYYEYLYHDPDDSNGFAELSVHDEIALRNPDILSLQYWGTGFRTGAAHPNKLFFTTNMNMKTGKRIKLEDVIHVNRSFAEKLLNHQFTAVWPFQKEALETMSVEELLDDFGKADSLDTIGTEEQTDTFSYFTNDSLGISIGGIGYALGDHAEFKMKYEDLKDDLKAENEIWKGLTAPDPE